MESDEESPFQPIPSREEIISAFSAAERCAEDVQRAHMEAAQYAGYTRDVFRAAGPFYANAAEMAQEIPQLRQFVISGMRFVTSAADELDDVRIAAAASVPVLHSVSASAHTFITASGTAAMCLPPSASFPVPLEAPPFFAPIEDKVANHLARFSPALAKTYQEIGQACHGTIADPYRAAMAMMRQVFDEFFLRLAPDEAVRASPYWTRKSGPNPDQVTRRERMTCAALTHIKEPKRARTIVENIDHVLDTYQLLNRLHTRGTLSEKQARAALTTLKSCLETWVDATSQERLLCFNPMKPPNLPAQTRGGDLGRIERGLRPDTICRPKAPNAHPGLSDHPLLCARRCLGPLALGVPELARRTWLG